jgi:hypothetical protein
MSATRIFQHLSGHLYEGEGGIEAKREQCKSDQAVLQQCQNDYSRACIHAESINQDIIRTLNRGDKNAYLQLRKQRDIIEKQAQNLAYILGKADWYEK